MLKLAYVLSKLCISGISGISGKNIKFRQGNYQPTVPQQKHSIV